MDFFTIGYGGRTKDHFLGLVKANGIKTVVDVRLRPDRSSMNQWVKAKTPDKGVESWLEANGIGYVSLVELGNPFHAYDNWPWRYKKLLSQAGELLIEGLHAIEGPWCLMCAEKRHEECHRLLLADYLWLAHGWKANHLV